MSAFIDGIGAVSGVLGIIQFAKDNIPSDPPVGAAIRVKLGLGTKGDSHGIVRALQTVEIYPIRY